MNELIFDELTHTYTYGGKELKSVTTLLRELGVSPAYSNIKQSILEAAAKYGNEQHEVIEAAAIGLADPCPDSLLLPVLKDGDSWRSEVRYFDPSSMLAGTGDLESDEYIVDIKTTAKLHNMSVQLQCSVYVLLSGKHDRNIGVLWVPKKGEHICVPLTLDLEAANIVLEYSAGNWSKEIAVAELIKRGYIEQPIPLIVGADELAGEYLRLKKKIDDLTEKQDVIKESLKKVLTDGGGKHEGLFKATYSESSRTTYDAKQMASDGIDLSKYEKVSSSYRLNVS